jgi:hypothetical protein
MTTTLHRHTRVAAAAVVATALAIAAAAARAAEGGSIDWPALQAPPNSRSAIVAPDVMINGQRSRIVQSQLAGSLDDARAFYKQQFGGRFVENRWKDAWLIASRQGGFFHTVQLDAKASGRVQAMTVSTVVGTGRARSAVLADTERLLPPDSVLALSNESNDGPLRSVLATGVNRQSIAANVDHVVDQLAARGYRVTRRDDQTSADGRATRSVWLEGAPGSAIVSVVDVGEQRAVSIQRSKDVSSGAAR